MGFIIVTCFGLAFGLAIYHFLFKRSQQSQIPYKEILEKVPQGLMLFNQESNLIFFNHTIDQLIDVYSLIEDDLKELKQFIRQNISLRNSIKLKGREYFVEKWQQGEYVAIAFELSEQKKIHQVGKDFVANASHELRTPITIIKGFAETLKDLPEISDAMLHDFTDKILRSCQRMDNLVKNLLLLADLDHAKRIHKQQVDLLGLIESVSYTLLSIHPDSFIETFSSHEEIVVSVDPDMFEQALLNLLENAVKYSKKPAHITMIVEKFDEGVSLKIKDQGVGIQEEHLPHIFKRFYRVNQDRSRKLGGAGLGLSIVLAIIEKHHAKIEVASKENEGTTFTIFFNEKADCIV